MNNVQGKEIDVMSKMSLIDHVKTYYQFFFSDNNRVPKVYLPKMNVPVDDLTQKSSELQVAWLGHSSLLINIEDQFILTDPVFPRKVSPVGPTNFHNKPVLNKHNIPNIDAVIISHDHYDHLNSCTIRMIHNKVERFIVPTGVGSKLKKWGVDSSKITELLWWEDVKVSDNLKITATPAQHFSGRGLFDRNKTLWASWVIQSDKHNIFFSGDSGYFEGFKEIGKKFGPFDVTFLECGAYDKKWPNVHMFPEETVQAHIDLKGKLMQPIHWGTYNLALHSWFEPMDRVVEAAKLKNVKLSTPVPGKIVNFSKPFINKFWWPQLKPADAHISLAKMQSI